MTRDSRPTKKERIPEMLQDSDGRRRHTGWMDDDRIAQLSDGQKDCLRLVHARYQIKDIARTLGLAVSTINARLEKARRTMGVSTSVEAARLLIESEAGQTHWIPPTGSWNPMVKTPPPALNPYADTVEGEPQDTDAANYVGYDRSPIVRPTDHGRRTIRWPFSTAGRTDNDITPLKRLLWVPAAAAISLIMLAIVAMLTVATQDILATLQHQLARIS